MLKRSTFTKKRRALTTLQKQRLGRQAVRHLNHAHVSRQSQHIGMYIDDFGELPTKDLFLWAKKRKKSIYLPVVVGSKLRFRRVYVNHLSANRFAKHSLGMKEPKTGKTVAVNRLDWLFLPLVACDKKGNRMGMGGGFYDRTLAAQAKFSRSKTVLKKPYRIGWAYNFQLVQQLSTNPWDVPLHAVVLPAGIINMSNQAVN